MPRREFEKRVFCAKWDYLARADDELSILQGECIQIVPPPQEERGELEEGWVYGVRIRDGKSGLCPLNYLRPLETGKKILGGAEDLPSPSRGTTHACASSGGSDVAVAGSPVADAVAGAYSQSCGYFNFFKFPI